MIAFCHEAPLSQPHPATGLRAAPLPPTTEELRTRALESLRGAFHGTVWAVAESAGDDTTHVYAQRDVDDDDARELARRLPPTARVVVHGAGTTARPCLEPLRAATADKGDDEPSIAVGVWTVPGAAAPTDVELHLALQLVATVASSARALNALRVRMSTDEQTGVLNRAGVLELVERERERALRYRRNLSVIFIDLDSLKRVNDLHGHAAGDALITTVAHTLRAVLRNSDGVGRLGGDEFLAVLPETDARGARAAIDRVKQALASVTIRVGRTILTPSASFGLATLAEVGQGDLIGIADQRMLLSKRRRKKGRDGREGPERRRRAVGLVSPIEVRVTRA